jgi:hypothetical protein
VQEAELLSAPWVLLLVACARLLALPKDLRRLIHRMVLENVTWGEERIADELKLKLDIRVSPRTGEIPGSPLAGAGRC